MIASTIAAFGDGMQPSEVRRYADNVEIELGSLRQKLSEHKVTLDVAPLMQAVESFSASPSTVAAEELERECQRALSTLMEREDEAAT